MPRSKTYPLSRSTFLLAGLATCSCVAHSASLTPPARERLAAATFEVVLRKPESDPLTYEKPLPLDLLPYAERTDKYHSIGTAFLIAPNQFVTAAHVIGAGAGSQYGPPAIRDPSGKTYVIDQILKYAVSEDYSLFTVRDPPAVSPLETRNRPAVNDAVFAVGNAFGEGVVVRDGLYTSDTPEELDGRWKWLRFSAAASPGNSGGPLVDRNGKVIGVVLRKSANENLNFAVSIQQVLSGTTERALLEGRSPYHPLVANASDTARMKESFPLPKSVPDFYSAILTAISQASSRYRLAYLKAHEATLFPHGEHSQQLLHTIWVATLPRIIAENENNEWSALEPTVHRENLDANGFVEVGSAHSVAIGRIHLPDDVAVQTAFENSVVFMDLLLKTANIQRPVGADRVRVTSLGKAQAAIWHTDLYGRRWLYRSWNMPFSDSTMIVEALPTPDGCAVLLSLGPTFTRDIVRDEFELLTNFVYLSYTGTLRRWKEYMTQSQLLPAAMNDVLLQFDYDRGFGIKTSKFKMLVPAALQKIAPDSVLTLDLTFLPVSDGAVWEIGGVFLADSKQQERYVDLLRRPHPPPAMPEDFQRRWRAMTIGAPPFNATPAESSGGRRIDVVANAQDVAAGKTDVAYTLEARAEATQSDKNMKRALDTLQHGLTILEH